MEISILVAYATPEKQCEIPVVIPAPATVASAITQSGILDVFPGIAYPNIAVGIFSEPVTLETQVKMGDRIEIYRDLTMDPKDARRLRAKSA